jgi:hypothetical protein
MKEDISRAVKEFFQSGIMPEGVNDTIIVLVPKIAYPEKLADVRPISLCNVLYKVVSKCLVNRLRPLLGKLIAPNQSTFVPGRMITYNALIAFECIHAIQQGSSERNNFCAYKLDLSKAYDRVDWSYLEKVLVSWVFRVCGCGGSCVVSPLSVILFASMGFRWSPSIHLAVYAKVILCLHIRSCLCLRLFLLLCTKKYRIM